MTTTFDTTENNVQLDMIKPKLVDSEVSVTFVDLKDDDPGDKKLRRKLDWHLMPTILLLYLLSFLDRVNIGQAKLNGLAASLNLSSTQYNACLSVFFATYIVFEIPSNLVLKRMRPSHWIPLIMVAWGIIVTTTGLVHSYGSLLACRLLLGAAEAGLSPDKKYFDQN
jgi:sugar phosphate permease